MPPSSQPVDQVDGPASLGSRRKFIYSFDWVMSNNKLASRQSKTKAMRDAAWRSLKPKSFPRKSLSTPDTQKVTVRPPKKKRKASSGQGLSELLF